jgi:hypothetical protein
LYTRTPTLAGRMVFGRDGKGVAIPVWFSPTPNRAACGMVGSSIGSRAFCIRGECHALGHRLASSCKLHLLSAYRCCHHAAHDSVVGLCPSVLYTILITVDAYSGEYCPTFTSPASASEHKYDYAGDFETEKRNVTLRRFRFRVWPPLAPRNANDWTRPGRIRHESCIIVADSSYPIRRENGVRLRLRHH